MEICDGISTGLGSPVRQCSNIPMRMRSQAQQTQPDWDIRIWNALFDESSYGALGRAGSFKSNYNYQELLGLLLLATCY
jgi:hypothetical protein